MTLYHAPKSNFIAKLDRKYRNMRGGIHLQGGVIELVLEEVGNALKKEIFHEESYEDSVFN